MVKKFLLMAILPSIMLCFLFSSTATASRIQATLGWHNMMENDFYLITGKYPDDGINDSYFGAGDTIKRGKLRKSVLEERDGILLYDLDLPPEFEMWKVETGRKFDKWINKKGLQALRKAAKKQQKDDTGKKNGWRKDVYKDWKNMWKTDRSDIWDLYLGGNDNIIDAFKKLERKKIKGRIGDVKFVAKLDLFDNSLTHIEKQSEMPPVPEPATMVLFGLGLLGIAGVGRRKK